MAEEALRELGLTLPVFGMVKDDRHRTRALIDSGGHEIGIQTTIGENDTLSAIVAKLVNANLLILLSDIDGLYTADPRKDPAATLIPLVEEISPEIMALAGGSGSSLGTGGMATKLKAACLATEAGIDMVIANGEDPELLYPLIENTPVGTRFVGKKA